jgi:phosphoribosylformylglycinamidine cyclo-ligase
MDYTSAGVNVKLADRLIKNIAVESEEIGKYAASYTLPLGASSKLVSSCDGVGTKVLLALEAKRSFGRSLSSIGEDCVAMVINDLLCENANPLFFMDYFATSSLNESDYNEVLAGIITACRSIGVKLIGGETAELPGMFKDEALDVCGFGVGTQDFLNWQPPDEGDIVIGLHSTGVHSNGFSLVRKILENNSVTHEFLDKNTTMQSKQWLILLVVVGII